MKWVKRILIVLAVLIVAIIGIGIIGNIISPRDPSVGAGMKMTLTAGGKKVIATALGEVNRESTDNGVKVTLDKKHVIVFSADSLTVNGEAHPFKANLVKVKSLKDGTVKVEQSSE